MLGTELLAPHLDALRQLAENAHELRLLRLRDADAAGEHVDHALHGLRYSIDEQPSVAERHDIHTEHGALGLDHHADVTDVFLRLHAAVPASDLHWRARTRSIEHSRVIDERLVSLRRELALSVVHLAGAREHAQIFRRERVAELVELPQGESPSRGPAPRFRPVFRKRRTRQGSRDHVHEPRGPLGDLGALAHHVAHVGEGLQRPFPLRFRREQVPERQLGAVTPRCSVHAQVGKRLPRVGRRELAREAARLTTEPEIPELAPLDGLAREEHSPARTRRRRVQVKVDGVRRQQDLPRSRALLQLVRVDATMRPFRLLQIREQGTEGPRCRALRFARAGGDPALRLRSRVASIPRREEHREERRDGATARRRAATPFRRLEQAVEGSLRRGEIAAHEQRRGVEAEGRLAGQSDGRDGRPRGRPAKQRVLSQDRRERPALFLVRGVGQTLLDPGEELVCARRSRDALPEDTRGHAQRSSPEGAHEPLRVERLAHRDAEPLRRPSGSGPTWQATYR